MTRFSRPTLPRATRSTRALIRVAWSAALVVAARRSAMAQVAPPPAPAAPVTSNAASPLEVMTGTVRSGASPVVGAQVLITPVASRGGAPTGPGRLTLTGDNGQFRVPNVPAGRVTVAVRRIGFQALALDTDAVSYPALNLTLTPVAQRLAAVVVRERRRGQYTGYLADFNRRRDLGFGHFITQTEIEDRHPVRTTDLLRMIPGMSVLSNGPFNALRLRNGRCDPLIWLDGMPALAGYLDLDAYAPSSISGIEIYNGPATVPVELRGSRGEEACGVIAVWSRLPDRRPSQPKHVFTAADLERLVESATVYTAEQVDRPAALDSAAQLAVSYPDSLRNTHTAGEATVEFVVDTTGAVEAGTVGIVTASHPGFANAARLAAHDARFIPAERAGHTVRQLVQLPLRWEKGR